MAEYIGMDEQQKMRGWMVKYVGMARGEKMARNTLIIQVFYFELCYIPYPQTVN